MRACAVAAGPWTSVAAQALAPWNEQRAAIGLASAIAVLVTTLLGALAGVLLARTLLAPLARLQRAVEHVEVTRPSDVRLGPDEGVAEVDALRGALRTVLARLAVSLSRSQRFARDAAHELRTPLATMLGELELAAESLPSGSTEELRRAHRVATRLSGLVERLLILARVDEPTELREEVSLRALLDEVEDELPPEQRARLRIEGDDVRVRGEPSLLAAMLSNVIDNALKFSAGPVSVALRDESGGARVIVSDEGPGLSEEERARVFEAFHRSPAARASGVPGHGVGLSLVQHVAALHGGSARFVDVPRGARLEVSLRPPPPTNAKA
jgi:signal transduction histidine kinase